jgi:enoyl-CoA hydratase/carnithine racemase
VSELVHVEAADGIAIVTVENPPVNALTNATIDALGGAIEALSDDRTVRAVVITGAGEKAFIAGADIGEFGAALGRRPWIEDHVRRTARVFFGIERLPQPVVAAVQGSAVGGGLEVALVCDLIVSDPNALFGLPEVRLGLMPGGGGTQRLPRRIGAGRAKELLLLGDTIDAAEALRVGLVNRISEPGGALAEARGIAERLASLSAVAVQAIKLATNITDASHIERLERERDLFFSVFESQDAREGLQAFVEKRRPLFAHS